MHADMSSKTFLELGEEATLIGTPNGGTAFRRPDGHDFSLKSSPPNNSMLRISINESEGNVVTLRLEGQIVGAWISELDGACERMLTAGRKVTLDLGDVSLIDRPGLTLLASLSQHAVALVRCSPFQEEQLRLASSPQPDTTL